MKETELLGPKHISILGADAMVKGADLIANLVKEP